MRACRYIIFTALLLCLRAVAQGQAGGYPFMLEKGTFTVPAHGRLVKDKEHIRTGFTDHSSIGVMYDSVWYYTGYVKVISAGRMYELQYALDHGLMSITDSVVRYKTADTIAEISPHKHPYNPNLFYDEKVNYIFHNLTGTDIQLVVTDGVILMPRGDTTNMEELNHQFGWLMPDYNEYWSEALLRWGQNPAAWGKEFTDSNGALLERFGLYRRGTPLDTTAYSRLRNAWLDERGYEHVHITYDDYGLTRLLKAEEAITALNREGNCKMAWASYTEAGGVPRYIIDTGGYTHAPSFGSIGEATAMLQRWAGPTVIVFETTAWQTMEQWLLPQGAGKLAYSYPAYVVYRDDSKYQSMLWYEPDYNGSIKMEDGNTHFPSGMFGRFFDRNKDSVSVSYTGGYYWHMRYHSRVRSYRYMIAATFRSAGKVYTFYAREGTREQEPQQEEYMKALCADIQQRLLQPHTSVADAWYQGREAMGAKYPATAAKSSIEIKVTEGEKDISYGETPRQATWRTLGDLGLFILMPAKIFVEN